MKSARATPRLGIIHNALNATTHQFQTVAAGNVWALALAFASVLSAHRRKPQPSKGKRS